MAPREIGRQKKRRGTGLLLAVALIPLLCAATVRLKARPPVASISAQARPSLAFDQYSVNLGTIPPLPRVAARFRFTNVGSHAVRIAEIRPSCGCLAPRLEKREYAPGESGHFVVRAETPGQSPGPKDYRIRVIYEDPQRREAVLTFKMTLPERDVAVEPRALIFYQLGRDAISRNITVTDGRTQPLRVETIECSLDFVEVQPVPSPEGGKFLIKVTVPGRVPAGKHRGLVTIHTSDPRYRKLTVPLLVQGR